MKKIVLNISDYIYEKLRFEAIFEKKDISKIIEERLIYKVFDEEVEQAFSRWMNQQIENIVKE